MIIKYVEIHGDRTPDRYEYNTTMGIQKILKHIRYDKIQLRYINKNYHYIC